MIRFLSWFIAPLGYQIVPIQNTLVVRLIGKDLDNDLVTKIFNIINNHEPEFKDNVVRFDRYV